MGDNKKRIIPSAFHRRHPFRFSYATDVMLLRETVAVNPFGAFKNKGRGWSEIVQNLVAANVFTPNVTARCARERVGLLVNKHATRIMKNGGKSGVDDEITEKDDLLDEILELKEASIRVESAESAKIVEDVTWDRALTGMLTAKQETDEETDALVNVTMPEVLCPKQETLDVADDVIYGNKVECMTPDHNLKKGKKRKASKEDDELSSAEFLEWKERKWIELKEKELELRKLELEERKMEREERKMEWEERKMQLEERKLELEERKMEREERRQNEERSREERLEQQKLQSETEEKVRQERNRLMELLALALANK